MLLQQLNVLQEYIFNERLVMWIINNQANFDILKPRIEINKTFKSQKN